MRNLIELRDEIKRIYYRFEFAIVPVLKFMLAFWALSIVSGKLGYMYQLDNLGLILIVSLLCSFLPNGFIILFGVALSIAHIYALSLEVAIVGLAVYLLLFLLLFRLGTGTRDSLIIVFTVLCSAMKIPYVIPIAVGLLATPASVFAVICGLTGYHMLHHVVTHAQSISNMGEEEAVAKIRLIVDGLIHNKEMLVMIIAFAITIIVVYIIRRLSIDYSWTIAMVSGAILNVIIILVGDLMYDTNSSLVGAAIGSLLAVAVGKILEFMRFSVDYSRVENVQFEDDEYYYYVKAIPKITMTAPTKTVKHINVQRQGGSERRVVTERTGTNRKESYGKQRVSGKSVTIGKNNRTEEVEDFFEDLD
ncbi:MAG: hypothetical protein IKK33_10485 [Lachnospiraceae bacterium]|nr:hypothetical protein [Lachnospiraceae bacterium]